MTSGRNWNRPTFRTRGRATESVMGGDTPREFQGPPVRRQSKAEAKAEADRLVAEFMARKVKADRAR